MLLSPAQPPHPLTYASMSAYFTREGYSIETRTLRDLGKDLAGHFLGRYHDSGPSGSRIYDNDTWDMWKDVVEWKLKGHHRPRIEEMLREKYGAPRLQQVDSQVLEEGDLPGNVPRPPGKPIPADVHVLDLRSVFREKQLKGLLKSKNRQIKQTERLHFQELEFKHQQFLDEKKKREEAEKRLISLDVVLPKRKKLLSRAAKLQGILHRKERLKILDELTSLELNPTGEEENQIKEKDA